MTWMFEFWLGKFCCKAFDQLEVSCILILFKRTEESFSFVIILVGKHVRYVWIDFYASKGKKFQLLSSLVH